MKKLELAIKVICDDIEKEVYNSGCYVNDWNSLLWALGMNSQDMKKDIEETLAIYSNNNHDIDLYLNDYFELELEDGKFITYRQLSNEVRKELKKRKLW